MCFCSSLQQQSGTAVIVCGDNGDGMPAENKERTSGELPVRGGAVIIYRTRNTD
jgi:hypothetical protein